MTIPFLLLLTAVLVSPAPLAAGDAVPLKDAVLEIGNLYAAGNWQAIIDLTDFVGEKPYLTYLSYMKGKASEQMGHREAAAGYYREVRALEKGLPAQSRLLTLLADTSLLPWLVYSGDTETSAAVLSEILELESSIDPQLKEFRKTYGLTPPDKGMIKSRIAGVKEPFLFVLKAGDRELTGITVDGQGGTLTIIYEDGYYRILENRIFFTEKEAAAAGRKRGKRSYVKNYGPSLFMTQYGAYREFYGAWKKKKALESAD
jgi:hypothetical protein